MRWTDVTTDSRMERADATQKETAEITPFVSYLSTGLGFYVTADNLPSRMALGVY